jgi:hypothetical protein
MSGAKGFGRGLIREASRYSPQQAVLDRPALDGAVYAANSCLRALTAECPRVTEP